VRTLLLNNNHWQDQLNQNTNPRKAHPYFPLL
jgi:hypothetical protein